MTDKIRVIYVEPGEYSKLIEIENTFKAIQALVGGCFEVEDLDLAEGVVLVCNEMGKSEGLPLNRAIWSKDRKLIDVVAGAFFVGYLPSDNFESMPNDLAEKYLEKFKYPELFFDGEDEIEVKPYKPA